MIKKIFKILIVDDSPLHQAVLTKIFENELAAPTDTGQFAFAFSTAGSGAEALEKVCEDKPDLILLDIVMPGLSGYDVLTRLKSNADTGAIPVIVVSGLDEPAAEEKSFHLGAVDYISKPFKNSIVAARIKTHLRIVEQMRIIELLSLVDALTNIANRRSFDRHMLREWQRSVREQTPLSILMADIDHFKLFNDTYGHQQGDVALKIVAAAIEAIPKRSTDLTARWGGEEFAVLLPNTRLPGALQVAEQIRLAVEQCVIPGTAESSPRQVTVSIGVTTETPGIHSQISDFIRRADSALYLAKERGRNRVVSTD